MYLVGFKFGKREVIAIDETKLAHRICRCECGNIASVSVSAILKGTAIQCKDCSGKERRQKLVGTKNGRLTVLEEYYKMVDGKKEGRLICLCDCGKVVDIIRDDKSRTKSCGCSRLMYPDRERHAAIHVSWRCMHQRCYNEQHENYKHYGGKGVTICERWHTFINFYEDTKDSWFKGSTIDRFPVNDGNYTPNNYRWATVEQQNRNKPSNRFSEQDVFDIRNSTLSQADLARKYNVGTGSISRIINKKRWATL